VLLLPSDFISERCTRSTVCGSYRSYRLSELFARARRDAHAACLQLG
jgi:hypothetical protein